MDEAIEIQVFFNKTSHRLIIIGSHWVHILPSNIHKFSDDFGKWLADEMMHLI
jgi:hypothetical protein